MRRARFAAKLPANYTRDRMLALAQTDEQRARIERDFPEVPKKLARVPSQSALDIDSGPKLTKRRKVPLERTVKDAVLKALLRHPRVADAWVTSAGLINTGDRYIRLGRTGLPDILGFTKDAELVPWSSYKERGGQIIACEVKRPGGKPEPHQQRFLDRVKAAGGIAFCATCVEDVERELG